MRGTISGYYVSEGDTHFQIKPSLGALDLAAGDPGDHDGRANHVCVAA
jgi:hypothetical protein